MSTKKRSLGIVLLTVICGMIILSSANAFAATAGDVNNDGNPDLKDVIMSLQISADLTPKSYVYKKCDINGDGRIGLEEAVYDLQVVAGLREKATVWYKDADGDKYSDGTTRISVTRPSAIYFEESELTAISGDENDNDISVHPEAQKETYQLSSLELITTIGYDGKEQIVLSSNLPRSVYIGKPVLPVIPTTIVIPSGHTLDHIEVVPGEKVVVAGSHTIEHGEMPYPLMDGVVPVPTPRDASVYGSDEPYPGKLYDNMEVQTISGVSVLMVNLYPVEYKPLSGQIAYYKTMSLKVITHPSTVNRRETRLRTRPAKVSLRIKVDNPEVLSTYTESPRPEKVSRGDSLCNPTDTYQYVLITSKEIRDASTTPNVRDLLAHRQSQGLSGTIVTIEDIYANYSGRDNPEKLRNFIIDAYNNWETEFVLLGGDTNIIPMRKLWCEAWAGSSYITEIPSDLYYQCLDGDYNSDGDNLWGEPHDGENGGDVDLLSELSVGRASAENTTEMSNFVYKTLAYERDSSANKKNVLMCGERLGFGGESEYATGSLEEIRISSSRHGYSTVGFSGDSSYSVDTLYDSENRSWDASELISQINSGKYSIINHFGHAYDNYVMKLYNSHADTLGNSKFLFAYSQGCLPGNFEADSIAEHLTTSKTRSGMFAVVYNSRYGWGSGNSTDGPSQRYNREFWDALFNENIVTLGEMNADSHEDNAWRINSACMRWCYYETNLLGDPAVLLGSRTAGCSYTISPAGNSVSSSGGSGSVSVTSPYRCSWTATSNAGWLTISSGSSGNGNGTVSYSIASNSGINSRTGTLTIAGQTFTVTQAGCTFSISSASQSFTASGGSGSVSVTSQNGCTWNAISNVSWITSGSSGTGNGTANYTVAVNTGTSSRTGTLTIAGKTFTVNQEPCSFSISPSSSPTLAYTGGSGSITVTSLSGCTWTAVPGASWISITSGNSGNGNGTVNYSVTSNSDARSRTGSITIAGQTFTVTQGHNTSYLIVPAEYATIQAAIDAASDGMTVWVADGTYKGSGNKDLDFKGKKITLRSENGAATTIIDCENSGRGFYFHSGETSASVVSGFTIKNGNVMNTGGGIHCENSSPTISNCVVTNCQVTLNYTSYNDFGGGAGIYAKNSNITIKDSTITNCTVNGQWANCGGGGLYFYTEDSSVTTFPSLTNCLISSNKADLGTGGGIYSSKCSLAISKCNITDNSAWYEGGILIEGSGYTSGNGLSNVVITDSNILRNTAKQAGGIGINYYAKVTMERCNISQNIADRDGGGGLLCSLGTSTTLKNCVVSKNTAINGGGGIQCQPMGTTLTIINSTITDNNGTTQGGAIYCSSTSPPTSVCIPDIANSIIWGNTPNQIYLADLNSSPIVTYSDIQGGGYAGAGNINADPLFVGNGDYHLTASSPCVNTGTSGGSIPTTDIEGKSRPQGSGYDMGAYER